MSYTLLEALILQGMNTVEAKEAIDNMKDDVYNGSDPEDVLFTYGLEPDYAIELID